MRTRTAAAVPDEAPALPLLFRLAAAGDRMLAGQAVRLIKHSPVAAPVRRALAGAAPAAPTLVAVRGGRLRGLRMLVDLSREKYYWLGTHEEPVQAWLAAHVRPGFTVYDVGAHAGFFTLLCARLAGPAGRIVAFEPRAENVERLRANASANGFANIEIDARAVSDRPGEAAFTLVSSTLEGRLAADGDPADARVPATTIDACVGAGMLAPDVIKVDVEGAEGAVIRGAARTIASRRPLLVLEVHSADAGREVAAALPCAYEFEDLASGQPASWPLPAGHFAGRLAVSRGGSTRRAE